MLTKNQKDNRNNVMIIDMDRLVPKDHLLRKVEKTINFDFIYDAVKHLYADEVGRPSIDPVVLFKIVFIQLLFNIRSMRRTIEEIEVNAAYRWFLGFDFNDEIPHFSTFGKNYVRRFEGSDVFKEIFNTILFLALKRKLVNTENIFIDSTHIKAYANKRQVNDIYVNESTHKYIEMLHNEINEIRRNEGKPEIDFNRTVKVTKSLTDPDCGMFNKGEKERQLAYSDQVICDENGWVLSSQVFPANQHDGVTALDTAVDYLDNHPEVKVIVMDSGYQNPVLLNEIFKRNVIPVLPYRRPLGRSTNLTENGEPFINKNKFNYIDEHDYYVCPNMKMLTYRGTNKEGYREYRSSSKDCKDCPFKGQCTKQKYRLLTRHQYESQNTQIREIRLSELGKEVYPKRKTSIERVFGISKMNHCLGFTFLRGLIKNEDRSLMIFSMYNLKKLATLIG